MIRVTVIGGYLGAGKTTLVNHMLRNAQGMKLAILVNEFGALPIDEDLIEAQDDTLISIAGGCVCCSYGNDLVQAMLDLSNLPSTPDHVLVEASGVALPGAIGATLSIIDGFALDSIVVLADAETIHTQLDDPYIGDTVARQCRDADMILLTKSDLVGSAHISAAQTRLATISPGVRCLPVTDGKVDPAVILETRFNALRGESDLGHADLTIVQSHSFPMHGEIDADALLGHLTDPALGVLRAKGFVTTRLGLKTLQIVGKRGALTDAPDTAKPGLVVIAPRDLLNVDAINMVIDRCTEAVSTPLNCSEFK